MSLDGFLGFLQYLYTDDVSFVHHDAIEVLKVANQFCSARLVTLCEVCLERKMESSLATSKRKSERIKDLIELVVTAQVRVSRFFLICFLIECTNSANFKVHHSV